MRTSNFCTYSLHSVVTAGSVYIPAYLYLCNELLTTISDTVAHCPCGGLQARTDEVGSSLYDGHVTHVEPI